MERLRQSSAPSMEVDGAELEAALTDFDWVTLEFNMAALEERYATYRARCARLLGATPWLTRAGILVVRVGADVVQGVSRGTTWHPREVWVLLGFVALVASLRAGAKCVELRDGDGSRDRWTRHALALAVAHAAQIFLAYFLRFGDAWSRPYYLGLDVAVDGGLFSLCFGLKLKGVLLALSLQMLVLPAVYLASTRRNPLAVLRAAAPALTTAFGTDSSTATLPVTLRSTKVEESGHVRAVVCQRGSVGPLDFTCRFRFHSGRKDVSVDFRLENPGAVTVVAPPASGTLNPSPLKYTVSDGAPEN